MRPGLWSPENTLGLVRSSAPASIPPLCLAPTTACLARTTLPNDAYVSNQFEVEPQPRPEAEELTVRLLAPD